MEKNQNIPAGMSAMYVVSTSHMDWDWIATFEEYYNSGGGGHASVRYILDEAMNLLSNNPDYQYNLAEISWLRRYMLDQPAIPPSADLKGLFFLGGGFTSPDNVVCNGEAFIRNYLVGRAIIRSLGLSVLLTDVCWIPDDFGHDPQLPVVLTAMNMTGVSFWRIPGNEPTQFYYPSDGSDSLALQLINNGITFNWQAADGSAIIAQQMVNGYGVMGDQSSSTGDGLNAFVQAATLYGNSIPYVAPGNFYMAPCGGDFSVPSLKLLEAVADYNVKYAAANNVHAVMGTFQDYINALKTNNVQLQTISYFDASNFWTGHFASRVQLKINQQRAVNRLIAAETLLTLLQLRSSFAGAVMNGLQQSVNAAWENVLPSTHHDYVNGTSSDEVPGLNQGAIYLTEQLPLGESAVTQSEMVISNAMKLLGRAVKANSDPVRGEVPFVVFNPSGFSRYSDNCHVGNLVVIDKSALSAAFMKYRQSDSPVYHPVQTLQNGDVVFPYSGLQSTGYACVYFGGAAITSAETATAALIPVLPVIIMNNGTIKVTIEQASGWAISSIIDVSTGNEIVKSGGLCNQLTVYYENNQGSHTGGDGNIYQMGNEFTTDQTYNPDINTNGFFADTTSLFTGLGGKLIADGPYLWHFVGEAYNKQNELTMVIEYMLEIGEPMVRIRVTGRAATEENQENAASIVTAWQFAHVPAGINYGTGNHWNGAAYTSYWSGPTFRSTHDYITTTNAAGDTIAAIYHEAVRSWAFTADQLLGILLRNSPAGGRGARGYDTGIHTQNYAFRLPGVKNPSSCQPLQESIAFQQRLLVAPATGSKSYSMAETGMLAGLQQDNAIIRVARTQYGSGGVGTIQGPALVGLPFSFVVRLYQPTNVTTTTWNVNIDLPAAPVVSLVSALEEEIENVQQPPVYSNGIITVPEMPTLATVRIQTVGVTPVNEYNK